MKTIWRALLILLVIPQLALAGMVGTAAPDFSLKNLEGNIISLSDFSGKPMLLVHFNAYCHICREEVPLINQIQRENKNMHIVGIAIANDKKETLQFKKNFKAEFLLLPDPQKEVFKKYYVTNIPTIDIIDETGTIRYRGKYPGQEELKSIIEEMDKKKVMTGTKLWDKPPDFTLNTSQGETFRLSDSIGKKTILLAFISVRNKTIRQVVEIMKEIYSRYEREDLDIVRIAVGDSLNDVKEFREKYYVKFPILVDEKEEVAKLYGVTHPSKIFIINKKGRVRYTSEEISLSNLTSLLAKVTSYLIEELPYELLLEYLEKAAPGVENFEKLTLGEDQVIYVGTTKDNKKILARPVFKDILCDTCNNVHFVYSFDQKGKIRNIVLIEYIDIHGMPIEAQGFFQRLIEQANRKLPLVFKKDIDGITGATQSSKLILEGLNETPEIIKSLNAYRDILD
ncbi:MAG: redoxin domain-containing protein [Deltaproteobacteria bacterium]|nr:redoxin domain-containing protein [Deltaproteobacteria bacterium]